MRKTCEACEVECNKGYCKGEGVGVSVKVEAARERGVCMRCAGEVKLG